MNRCEIRVRPSAKLRFYPHQIGSLYPLCVRPIFCKVGQNRGLSVGFKALPKSRCDVPICKKILNVTNLLSELNSKLFREEMDLEEAGTEKSYHYKMLVEY